MKKNFHSPAITLTATVFIILCISSCTKLAKNLSYTYTFTTPVQTYNIPVIPNVATDTMPTVTGSYSYNIDSFIRNQTNNILNSSNLTSVKLNNVSLNLTQYDSLNNFRVFQYIAVAFWSTYNSTPYTVSANPPDVVTSSLALAPADTTTDFKSYMSGAGNTFYFSTTGKVRRGTTSTMVSNMTFTFTIKVQG